jgi:hypothetical protein
MRLRRAVPGKAGNDADDEQLTKKRDAQVDHSNERMHARFLPGLL